MKDLRMPRTYTLVPEEEQSSISGGGPLGDALNLFFHNLHLDDFSFGGSLISFSFTFVPLLLFNVVKTGFKILNGAYDSFAEMFHFSHEEEAMVQFINEQQQRKQQGELQTQSVPGPKAVF